MKKRVMIFLAHTIFFCVSSVFAQNIDSMYNDKDVATNHINRGLAHMRRGEGGDLDYAKQEFGFVIGMEEDKGLKPVAYLNLGVLSFMENNPDQAIKYYQSAIELKPDYAEAYFNLGAAYYKEEVLKKGEEAFLKAIELQPDYGRAYYSLGSVYFDQKKYDLAWKYAEKAAEYGVPYKTLKEKLTKVSNRPSDVR